MVVLRKTTIFFGAAKGTEITLHKVLQDKEKRLRALCAVLHALVVNELSGCFFDNDLSFILIPPGCSFRRKQH